MKRRRLIKEGFTSITETLVVKNNAQTGIWEAFRGLFTVKAMKRGYFIPIHQRIFEAAQQRLPSIHSVAPLGVTETSAAFSSSRRHNEI